MLGLVAGTLTVPVLLKKMPFHPPSIIVCMDTYSVSSGRGGPHESRFFPQQALYCGDDLEQIITADVIPGVPQPLHYIPSVHEKNMVNLSIKLPF